MKYLSLFSGIEAASAAWGPLGWSPVAFAEIEPFPSAVLAHHYPTVPNLGDVTKHEEWPAFAPDIIVGGSPCQAFSVAGLRRGLSDPRGNLTLTYLAIVARQRPRIVVWENVPGVLSVDGGRTFGAFLGALAELGYGFAYRVLDAQHFGVAQRRKRVFLVGCSDGNWSRAAQILLEPEGLSRCTGEGQPQREAPPARPGGGAPVGGIHVPAVAGLLGCGQGGGFRTTDLDSQGAFVSYSNAEGSTGLPFLTLFNVGKNVNNQTPLMVFRKSRRAQSVADPETWAEAETANTLNRFDTEERDTHAVVAFHLTQDPITGPISPAIGVGARFGGPSVGIVAPTLTASNDPSRSPQSEEVTRQVAAVHAASMAVRRLTPEECEELQGFPRGYTRIPYRNKRAELCPDGPRYRAIGNSMAVPCMTWIGQRIERFANA